MAGSKRRHTDTDNPDSKPTWDGNSITMRKWLNDIYLHPSRTVLRCDQDDGIAGLASSLAHELQETAGCCGMWRMCFMAMPNSSWRPRLSHNFDRTLWRGW